jgi:hypothetical protein
LTVNQRVVGSSPTWGAILFFIIGPLVKRLNTLPFHGSTHGFESHTGHHLKIDHLGDFFIAYFSNCDIIFFYLRWEKIIVFDKIIKHIDETIVHKQHVLESAKILSEYLILENRFDEALELINRCTIHDNSKFTKEEIYAFINITNKESLKSAKTKIEDSNKEALELHWKNNSHHPEYHQDYSMMSEMDIMEMACDWSARSIEYRTDLLEFVEIRQNDRFHFNESMYLKLYKYCQILLKKSKQKKI